MSFNGISLAIGRGTGVRALTGFSGISIEFEGVPIRVVDRRGRGLAGVNVFAENPTSELPQAVMTDVNGNAFIQVDDNSTLEATWFKIRNTVDYTNENQLTIVMPEPLKK
jgi:hypothetical protein